jgi:hypothetical protein
MWQKGLINHFIFAISTVWPAMVICRRAGIKHYWAFALFVPVFGMVVYAGALAFQPWPTLKKGQR